MGSVKQYFIFMKDKLFNKCSDELARQLKDSDTRCIFTGHDVANKALAASRLCNNPIVST
jgi:hypothetical protein